MKKTIIFVFVIGLTAWVYAGFDIYHIHFENRIISPPRPVVDSSKAAGHYHSITEMQKWCGAYPDGKWGMETDRLYKQKYNETYGNNIALELWPEMENVK